MSKKSVVRSNLLHKKYAKTNSLRANAAKTGTKNAFFGAKVEYHNEVAKLQSQRDRVLSKSERSKIYLDKMRSHSI